MVCALASIAQEKPAGGLAALRETAQQKSTEWDALAQDLEARITREALAVVRRAAEIQGRSVSDFVVAAAQEAAEKAGAPIAWMSIARMPIQPT